MRTRLAILPAFLTALALSMPPATAEAACGCEKPPPVAATVRPTFAFAARDPFAPCDLTKGGCVALFGYQLVAGQTYQVKFRHVRGHWRLVNVVAQSRRDLADGVERVQLWVPVPKLPLGPVAIQVEDAAGVVRAAVPANDFTLIAPPVVVPEDGGVIMVDRYHGSVGHDGTLYVALDVTGMLPRVSFAAQGYDLALRFRKEDMLIYNTQGVLMETLDAMLDEDLNNDGDSTDPGEGDWNGNGLLDSPDIAAVMAEMGGDSDGFLYERHPFEAYAEAHQPGGARALDPADPNWHVDGTRHTDNFHFVAAISNATLNGMPLEPGSTDPFTLVFDALVVDGQ